MIGVLVVSRLHRPYDRLDRVVKKFRGYIHTYVSINLTVRTAKALFDLAIWQFFFVLRREYEIFCFDYYNYISS